MNRTSIEWTDFSSNLIKFRDPDGKVVHGCVKVSPGCANCYASAISKRFSGGEFTASRQKTLVLAHIVQAVLDDPGWWRAIVAGITDPEAVATIRQGVEDAVNGMREV